MYKNEKFTIRALSIRKIRRNLFFPRSLKFRKPKKIFLISPVSPCSSPLWSQNGDKRYQANHDYAPDDGKYNDPRESYCARRLNKSRFERSLCFDEISAAQFFICYVFGRLVLRFFDTFWRIWRIVNTDLRIWTFEKFARCLKKFLKINYFLKNDQLFVRLDSAENGWAKRSFASRKYKFIK